MNSMHSNKCYRAKSEDCLLLCSCHVTLLTPWQSLVAVTINPALLIQKQKGRAVSRWEHAALLSYFCVFVQDNTCPLGFFFQNNHIKPGPVMLQNLLLPLARFLYFVLTMLEIIASCFFFTDFMEPRVLMDAVTFRLPPVWECVFFSFLLQYSWVSPTWMFEFDLWPWPLISALLMMAVNWWEAKRSGLSLPLWCDTTFLRVLCVAVSMTTVARGAQTQRFAEHGEVTRWMENKRIKALSLRISLESPPEMQTYN